MLNIHPMVGSRTRSDLAGINSISGSTRKEERLELVVHELSHRIKNLLAVVQAMANQTGQRSANLKDFQTVFSQRLRGLSRSIDLLVEESGQGASIADLVRSQLEPFGEVDGVRITATGPVVSLNPEATRHIGLALHELATNATKHGALSVPDGATTVHWQIRPGGMGTTFRLIWHEHNGPEVLAPTRRGFGHVVLQRITGQSLQGKVDYQFEPAGVSWTLEVPVTAVVVLQQTERDGIGALA
jgi:two-component sensor histidine kinase